MSRLKVEIELPRREKREEGEPRVWDMDRLTAGHYWSPSGQYLLPSHPREAFDPQRTPVRWR